MSNVSVCCRFRPSNKIELSEKSIESIIFDSNTNITINNGSKLEFSFDRIFGPNSTQEEVFNFAAKPIIDEILRGYNCTIFVYGQTGSGKSHSMMGVISNPELQGITPRLVNSLFEAIENSPSNLEFTVKVSYIEIYLEKIRDLLNPVADNLSVREGAKGVWIDGCSEVYVNGIDHVLELIDQGSNNRAIASTRMNMESSRSHSVFLLTLCKTNTETGSKTTSTLFLVDLAGSEKISKTGAAGQTLKEAQHINKSLSALGNVIYALTESKTHIPYRDSKLTRLLSDALGGNAKTCLIVTASTMSYNIEETISTLRFGARAKAIKNKAVINSERSVAEYKKLLESINSEKEKLEVKVEELTKLILAYKNGGVIPSDDSNASSFSTAEIDNLNTDLTKSKEEINFWINKYDLLEKEMESLNDAIDGLTSDLEISNTALETERLKAELNISQFNTSEQSLNQLKVQYNDLETLNKKLQYQLTELQREALDSDAKIENLIEYELRFVEMQKALHKKVEQNLDLSMQLDDYQVELDTYRNALNAKEQGGMMKVQSSLEVVNLKREIQRLKLEQDNLKLEMSQAIAELRERMQRQIDAKDKMSKNHQTIMDDLLIVLQDNSKIYRESADRDSKRIADLEEEVKKYRKFYETYNATAASNSTSFLSPRRNSHVQAHHFSFSVPQVDVRRDSSSNSNDGTFLSTSSRIVVPLRPRNASKVLDLTDLKELDCLIKVEESAESPVNVVVASSSEITVNADVKSNTEIIEDP